jgi:hypothetical protein
MKNSQRGVSLSGLIVVLVLLGLVAVLGMKLAPDVIEYSNIVKVVKAIAADPSVKGSVSDIRRSFDRRASVESITVIKAADLDIGKEGNDVVISFAYERRIPLFGPVSLLIDFQGSSAQ